MKIELLKRVLLASIGLWAALPAWSHHSTAMFDYSKTETVTGTIRDFQWANPHSYAQQCRMVDRGRYAYPHGALGLDSRQSQARR
jgi:hypothetical protein